MMLNSSFLPCFEGERAHSSNFKSDILDVRAGHCPECRLQFRKPVALPCGHSLCQPCCDQLLTRCNGNSVMSRRNSRRQSVLMGLSAIERRNRQKPKLSKTLSVINECDDEPTKKTVYSSPNCPVCLARPSFKQPVPNIALEKLLFAWDRYREAIQKTSFYESETRKTPSPSPSSTCSSGFEEPEDQVKTNAPLIDLSIKKCNIAVFGADEVGKTRLVRAQHLNKLFFGRIGAVSKEEDDLVNPIADLQAKYMIEILDNNDMEADLEEADGIILAYACNNHESFVAAFKIYEEVVKLGYGKLPLILVATKCDIDLPGRQIKQEEADALGRHIGCAHMEVSAKKNIGVNEVFAQLVRLIDMKN